MCCWGQCVYVDVVKTATMMSFSYHAVVCHGQPWSATWLVELGTSVLWLIIWAVQCYQSHISPVTTAVTSTLHTIFFQKQDLATEGLFLNRKVQLSKQAYSKTATMESVPCSPRKLALGDIFEGIDDVSQRKLQDLHLQQTNVTSCNTSQSQLEHSDVGHSPRYHERRNAVISQNFSSAMWLSLSIRNIYDLII